MSIHVSDPLIYRIVVSALSIALLLIVAGSIYLGVLGANIPDALLAFGGVVVGALAGLLAPSPIHQS